MTTDKAPLRRGRRSVDERKESLRWSSLAGIVVFGLFTLSNVPTPLYVIWQDEWGFSSGSLTVVFAGTYVAGIMLALLFAGRLADQYGRRPILLTGTALSFSASLVFLFANGLTSLLLARFLSGLAIACAVTAGLASCVDLAPADRKASGSMIGTVALVSGAGVGPLYAGIIARASSRPQAPIFITMLGISCIVLAISWILPLRKPDPQLQSSPRHLLPHVPRGSGRVLVWAILTAAPGMTAAAFMAGLAPSILRQVLGQQSTTISGTIVCFMFISGTIAQFPIKHLSMKKQLLVGPMSAIIGMAITALCVTTIPETWLFTCAALLCGIAQGTGQLAAVALIGLRIDEAHRSESNAALNLASYVPTALFPISAGYAADALGLETASLGFSATISAITAVCLGYTQTTYFDTDKTALRDPGCSGGLSLAGVSGWV